MEAALYRYRGDGKDAVGFLVPGQDLDIGLGGPALEVLFLDVEEGFRLQGFLLEQTAAIDAVHIHDQTHVNAVNGQLLGEGLLLSGHGVPLDGLHIQMTDVDFTGCFFAFVRLSDIGIVNSRVLPVCFQSHLVAAISLRSDLSFAEVHHPEGQAGHFVIPGRQAQVLLSEHDGSIAHHPEDDVLLKGATLPLYGENYLAALLLKLLRIPFRNRDFYAPVALRHAAVPDLYLRVRGGNLKLCSQVIPCALLSLWRNLGDADIK